MDSRLVADLQEYSIPFPVRKIARHPEEGAWYVFGTKLLQIREYDDDLLSVKEYMSHSDESFPSYISINMETMLQDMQQKLRTTHQHLLRSSDPI